VRTSKELFTSYKLAERKREMTYQILKGNSLDLLPTLADNSIDAIVTDPPYELGFMGKTWDNSGIAYSLELWQQCLRVLKPGGHLLAFSGSRTYHRMVVSIEDAGFEIRDMISWISNKTFPKSLNIGKAIDKSLAAERKVIGKLSNPAHSIMSESKKHLSQDITAPSSPDAQKWDGWGTGLKPTVEPIVMARKPVEGTVANNVLTYGTGGLNIDASRIKGITEKEMGHTPQKQQASNPIQFGGAKPGDVVSMYKAEGRWPANLILDEQAAQLIDEQSGTSKSAIRPPTGKPILDTQKGWNENSMTDKSTRGFIDSGGASRFFYVAKASKRDRNEGLEDLEDSNTHPTVKPTALMQYLVKLVTPPGGTILDPFTGSGSTGKAAILEGFDFIGIELTKDYWPIIEGRLQHAEAKVAEAKENQEAQPQGLF
jgi:site-specific DNA-methyltransferase (adenine-specific)